MQKEKPNESARDLYIERGGDGYDLAWGSYMQGKGHRLMSALLNEKKHTIKDTDQSYRVINHWCSLGLIEDERTSDSDWRKLSLLDLIWIQIVAELRQFGFPLEKLNMTKNTLFNGKPNLSPYTLFEFSIAQVFMKSDQYLVVLPDGKAAAISGEMLEINMRLFDLKNYMCISLNTILSKLYTNKDFSPVLRYVETLNEDEAEVLFQMRCGVYESVSVKMKDGKIELIEATETIDAQKRLIELLKEADYQEIQVKTVEGKIVSIKRTIKRKPVTKPTGHTRAASTEPLRPSEKPKSKAVRSNADR